MHLILNTKRAQTFEPDIFANQRLDQLNSTIIYAGFVTIAAEIIYGDAGAPYP